MATVSDNDFHSRITSKGAVMAKDVETGATQRHMTFMIYSKGNGRVIHISHVELAESASAPLDVLSEIERWSLEVACRIHGAVQSELGIISIDPKDFKPDLVYSVNEKTGTLQSASSHTQRFG
jgi:hypothetical protein